MTTPFRSALPFLLTALFGLTLFPQCISAAEDHVVSMPELRQAVNSAAQKRQADLSQVESFFSSRRVAKTLRSAHLDPIQIRKAIPTLSGGELARLSVETRQVQNKFAAGVLTNQQLTYIIIALGTAVLILIIFVAK